MNLTNLCLSRNKINLVQPRTFCSLFQLEELDLSQNFIETIDQSAYSNLPSLEFFYVTSPNINQIDYLAHEKKEVRFKKFTQTKPKTLDTDIKDISNSEKKAMEKSAEALKVDSVCCIVT